MAKRLVIGIDWFGPYTRKEVLEAGSNFDGGLYLVGDQEGGTTRRGHNTLGSARTVFAVVLETRHIINSINWTLALQFG